jgi:hypothetical protein
MTMPKRKNEARPALLAFHAALVSRGLSSRLVDRRTSIVWQDRAGKWNTARVGFYALDPVLLRLYVNTHDAWVCGRPRHPEGPASEITFMPGEELLLAERFAEIMAGPDPWQLDGKEWTPAAYAVNPHHDPKDADRMRSLYESLGFGDYYESAVAKK